MGKNIIQQRRGKGSATYRAPSFRYYGRAKHIKTERQMQGRIAAFVHCPGHSAPLARIVFEGSEDALVVAPQGMRVGDIVVFGENAEVREGNCLPLQNIPEGTFVHNIESKPGDGGRFVRASGTFARVTAKTSNNVTVLLPSKKQRSFSPLCRAAIGVVAAGGRTEKPFLKAGNRYYKMRATNKLYPRTSGLAMNALAHPFGGSRSSKKGRPTIAPRNAPPGAKVGLLRPRRTGRRKL
jgi:large subunit ribosomal protein L2